ncbi:MAG TPA: hypothetical protein PLV42_04165 [bacterium]|nr:hypothetical protein [bacterium]
MRSIFASLIFCAVLFVFSCEDTGHQKSDRDGISDTMADKDAPFSDDDLLDRRDDLLGTDDDTISETDQPTDSDTIRAYRLEFTADDDLIQDKITVLTPPNAPNGKYLEGTEVSVVFDDPDNEVLRWTMNDRLIPHPARDLSTIVAFNDAHYIIGGKRGATRLNDVWKIRADGSLAFVTLAPFPERSSHAAAVHNNTLYIAGGTTGEDELSDLWYTRDAINWEQHSTTIPLGARSGPTLVAFKEKLYLIGGDDTGSVLSSSDGHTWENITPNGAPYFSARTRIGALTAGEQLYLFGGTTIGSTLTDPVPFDEIWSSADALQWTKEPDGDRFSPRGNISIARFNERYYLVGGYPGDGQNVYRDLWVSDDLKSWQRSAKIMHPAMNALAPKLFVMGDKLYLVGQAIGDDEALDFLWRTDDGLSWQAVPFSFNHLTVTATQDATYVLAETQRYRTFSWSMTPADSADVRISPDVRSDGRVREDTALTVTITPHQNRLLSKIEGLAEIDGAPLSFTVIMDADKEMKLIFSVKGSRLWEEVPFNIPFETAPIAGHIAEFNGDLYYLALFRGYRDIEGVSTEVIWSESWISFDGMVWDYIQKDTPIAPVDIGNSTDPFINLFATEGSALFAQTSNNDAVMIHASADGVVWQGKQDTYFDSDSYFLDIMDLGGTIVLWDGKFYEATVLDHQISAKMIVPPQLVESLPDYQTCQPYLVYPTPDQRIVFRAACYTTGTTPVFELIDLVSDEALSVWQVSDTLTGLPDIQGTGYSLPFLERRNDAVWMVILNSMTYDIETYRSADGITWTFENLAPFPLWRWPSSGGYLGAPSRRNHATTLFQGALWRLDQYDGITKLYRMSVE